jgi:glycosyltransferase involved in cell wall biosynthesis
MIPPLPEIIEEGGLLINKNQPASAADSILNLLADGDAYRSLSQAAGRRAAVFTETSLSRALLDIFANITQVYQ